MELDTMTTKEDSDCGFIIDRFRDVVMNSMKRSRDERYYEKMIVEIEAAKLKELKEEEKILLMQYGAVIVLYTLGLTTIRVRRFGKIDSDDSNSIIHRKYIADYLKDEDAELYETYKLLM